MKHKFIHTSMFGSYYVPCKIVDRISGNVKIKYKCPIQGISVIEWVTEDRLVT